MKPLLALILFSLSFSSFAARISLYDEPLTQFSSWVSQQTGKTIIVSSDLHSFLVNVDGDYSGHEELLSLYRAILQANELQMQFQEGFYRVTKRVAKPPVHVDDSIKLKVYKLLNVRPEDLHENIKPFIQASVSVSVMPSSSSIAFYGPEPHVDALIEFSQLFDVKPKQVLIEAVLMETNVTNAESVGVFIRSQLSQSGFSASSNTAIGDVNFESKGGILSYLTGGDIRLFINMIRNNDDVTILSEPRLVSLDRQQAYMTVGQNVPFITGTQSTDGGGVVQSIERKDVGLTVRVKPELVVNHPGFVGG